MAQENGTSNGGDSGGQQTDSVKVTVDGQEKTLTIQDVQGMIDKQADATQKAQQAAAVLNASDQLGIDPEQFLARSQAAFTVLNDLVEQNIIDDEGKVLVNPQKNDPPEPPDPNQGNPPAKGGDNPEMDRITKTIQAALDPIHQKFEGLERDVTSLNRIAIQSEILKRHSDLSGDDVTRILGIAKANPQKKILQHAEEYAKAKKENYQQMRKQIAQEFGIDADKFDENKLNEQGDEGGASAIFKGKKFSFSNKGRDGKKRDDVVSPRKATEEFFNKSFSE